MGIRQLLRPRARTATVDTPPCMRMVRLHRGARVNAVGEASYQDALEHLAGGKREDSANLPVVAHLVREPTNPFDSNAIKVMVGEALVGYLCRDDAVRYQPVVAKVEKAGGLATCEAFIVGGWRRPDGDEGHFGIWLNLADPHHALDD